MRSNKKTDELYEKLADSYEQQTAIYNDILTQVVDPRQVSGLLRQLEALAVRRQVLNRQLEIVIEQANKSWIETFFG